MNAFDLIYLSDDPTWEDLAGTDEEETCCEFPTPAIHDSQPYCQHCDKDLS